jgi:hypothetical protein
MKLYPSNCVSPHSFRFSICFSFLLLLATALFQSCGSESAESNSADTHPRIESGDQESKISGSETADSIELCQADARIKVHDGNQAFDMEVISALAVPRINFNEQTDTGDVAKPGYTISLANFELAEDDPWGRPNADQQKLEIRLQHGKDEPLTTGIYKSAAQGIWQVAPVIYSDGKTSALGFPKIGSVEITELSDERVCGILQIKTLYGHRIEGAFSARVVDVPNQLKRIY